MVDPRFQNNSFEAKVSVLYLFGYKTGFSLTIKYPKCLSQFHVIQGCHGQGKNMWKMKFFPGQGRVREFCGWPGKLRKDLESLGKVREFENKWLWQAVSRKFIYSV